MIKIAIIGALGRMGQSLIKIIINDPSLQLAGAIGMEGTEGFGKDIGQLTTGKNNNIFVTNDLEEVVKNADCLIDFTPAGNTQKHIDMCIKHNKALVIGTTGLCEKTLQQIEQAGNHIPIIYASNFSVGVTLLKKLCRDVANVTKTGETKNGDNFAIKIEETHHIHKIDAPSGTAIILGKEIAQEVGQNFDDIYKYSGDINKDLTKQELDSDAINFVSYREGEVVGDHTVSFISNSESIHLTHNAHDRNIFANGAIKASVWLVKLNKKGLFSMEDVLFKT